jgi:hypothetical protein
VHVLSSLGALGVHYGLRLRRASGDLRHLDTNVAVRTALALGGAFAQKYSCDNSLYPHHLQKITPDPVRTKWARRTLMDALRPSVARGGRRSGRGGRGRPSVPLSPPTQRSPHVCFLHHPLLRPNHPRPSRIPLASAFSQGPLPFWRLQELASDNGVRLHTLHRAKMRLGVLSIRDGRCAKWWWKLPNDPTPIPPPKSSSDCDPSSPKLSEEQQLHDALAILGSAGFLGPS